jgi:ribosome-associated protein
MSRGSIRVTAQLALDPSELEERFVRAPGPGGQNVNKVSTAVQLRFDVKRSKSIPDAVRARLLRLGGQRVTAQGVLVIEAHRYRSQLRNREDARARLLELICAASIAPKPRRPTKPSAAAKARRLRAKRERSAIKQGRRGKLDVD